MEAMFSSPSFSLPAYARPPQKAPTLAPGSTAAALRPLVHHDATIAHDAPLERVQALFAARGIEFVAMVRESTVTGICSRAKLERLFGSRFGFALYSRCPAHHAQVAHPLVFTLGTPLREVLDRSLSRPRDELREDVALVDDQHALVGLVPVDALARMQTQLVSDQVAQLEISRQELLASNQALRESQGRYAGLFESEVMGVALVDVRGYVHASNRRLVSMLNAPLQAAAVSALAPWVSEQDRTAFLLVLESAAKGRAATREFCFNVPELGQRHLRCSFAWIAETSQICVGFDDVTEHRALERQLLRQEKQSLLDTLVGGIAHELNNKLTPVQGFSELIAHGQEGEKRHFCDLITKSVSEASHIIRQLLQLSKPCASHPQVVDLRTVLNEALSMLRFQIRDAACRVRTSQPAAAVWVHADPAEIKQVVINLALNALQAMNESDGPTLDLAVQEVGGLAQFTIQDNGKGIPAENLERIFDPFFTTKGPERGTGLGLSVCFSLVRQHGGTIEVESQPGRGAKFTVSLPCHEAPAQPTSPAPAPSPALEPMRSCRDARVLVVEDEAPVRRLIQTVLAIRFGCDVDAVANGVEAFERLAVHPYALVISDIRMPMMNGTELYLWLREAQPLTAQRFLFVTGYPGENHLGRDLADWNAPVLTKPFTVSQLCDACAPFLESAHEVGVSA